ncbi:hypothetical protein BD410DRAFT_803445 [Rickenella mellea]|uniref:Uncharacterized protein n=1 Tax=Rickenella mellea TaxID=50990 RepID=A0A4Y7Q3Q1_9AGAM|nr:hypothetical protein BD410DRAFT_803445 [Rickenella mellea]
MCVGAVGLLPQLPVLKIPLRVVTEPNTFKPCPPERGSRLSTNHTSATEGSRTTSGMRSNKPTIEDWPNPHPHPHSSRARVEDRTATARAQGDSSGGNHDGRNTAVDVRGAAAAASASAPIRTTENTVSSGGADGSSAHADGWGRQRWCPMRFEAGARGESSPTSTMMSTRARNDGRSVPGCCGAHVMLNATGNAAATLPVATLTSALWT